MFISKVLQYLYTNIFGEILGLGERESLNIAFFLHLVLPHGMPVLGWIPEEHTD